MEKKPNQHHQPETQQENKKELSLVYPGRIEDLKVIQTQYGNVSLASDIGLGHHVNEDRIFLDTTRNVFGVVDGMGGYARGEDSAQIVAEECLNGVNARIDPQLIQHEAHKRMKQSQIFLGGACYLYFQIEKKNVSIYWAGDVRLEVFDKNGNITYRTKSSPLEEAPRGVSSGRVSRDTIEITNHDILLVASDGLFDNVTEEDIKTIMQEASTGKTDDMAKKLFDLAKHGMEHGFMTDYGGMVPDKRKDYGKPDNVSIVVFQKLPS